VDSKDAEKLYSAQLKGLRASADLDVALPLLEERKRGLIEKAIGAFDSLVPEHRMTERDALLFVAALAENQRLINMLKNTEADGRKAGTKLFK
jgi:hypothetical protein